MTRIPTRGSWHPLSQDDLSLSEDPRRSRSAGELTEQGLRGVEETARAMLARSGLAPYSLAERTGLTWFAARDVLQALARRGEAEALDNGWFRSPSMRRRVRS